MINSLYTCIAKHYPGWMSQYRPEWMAHHHPVVMAQHQGERMTHIRPEWMEVHRAADMAWYRPEWGAQHRPEPVPEHAYLSAYVSSEHPRNPRGNSV